MQGMVTVKNLTKTFTSKKETVKALDNVTLTTPPNRILTLLGPSGCGKTTLLRCIAGLESPDAGEISIGDEVVWSKDKGISLPPERRGIGMVFQSYAIWPHMTVFGNVAYPLQIRRTPKQEIEERVRKVLDLVQLGGFQDRLATKLSGGQQQRVLIARALVTEPDLLMLDEPTSALDVTAEREIYQLLSELNDHTTIVLVTHDLGFVSGVVKSVLCVNRFVRRHPTTEMGELTSEILEDLYGSDLRLVRHDRNEGTWCCRD